MTLLGVVVEGAANSPLAGRIGAVVDIQYQRRLVGCTHRRQERYELSQLDRITMSPSQMGGRPCIRGMRVTVGMIVGQIGAGQTIAELLADYPYLEQEDVLQALRYAAWRAEEREIKLVG